MPPPLVPLLLIALGVPAGLRAALGRPRAIGPAWLLAFAAVLAAQAVGELSGARTGLLGEAQLLPAVIGASLATLGVAIRERFRG
ncbi:MAG TPA: hypothetical protein VM070_09115 [Candidatus Saccharimonadales bacterium]|nr:hypothetical protein [Candidatus Saccharimonadales bacterium]